MILYFIFIIMPKEANDIPWLSFINVTDFCLQFVSYLLQPIVWWDLFHMEFTLWFPTFIGFL